MENIEGLMPLSQRISDREMFCASHNGSEVANLQQDPASRAVGFILSPKERRLAWGLSSRELGEAKSISQFIVGQVRYPDGRAAGPGPCECLRSVDIIPIQGEEKAGIRTDNHFPPASAMS